MPPYYPRRKKRGSFRKGHALFAPFSKKQLPEVAPSRWGRRLEQAAFDRVAKPSVCGRYYQVTDADGAYGTASLLRPKKSTTPPLTVQYLQAENSKNKRGEMRLLHQTKSERMWVETMREHASKGGCDDADLYAYREIKRKACWRQALRCRNCHFRGRVYQLYDVVPSTSRGSKAAAPNVGLQVALQEMPIGSSKAILLFAAMNIPPPSRRGMDKTAAKVGKLISEAVEQDLREERMTVVDTNIERGQPETASVNYGVDGRYNSSSFGSRNKAGQNASQAISILIEHQTAGKKIVAAYLENKLCWTGSWLRNRGFDVQCPGGHADCTATISRTEPLSEYTMGERLGEMFARDGIPIKYVTSDGDARSAAGIEAAMKTVFPDWEVVRKADPVHIGQSQIKQTRSSTFSSEMFSGRTREEKKDQQMTLALDIKDRSHAVFTKMYQQHCGDMNAIAAEMPGVIAATVDCYCGDCRHCRRHSKVCGGGARNRWWHKSGHLTTGNLRPHMLNPNEADRILLRELLRIKLGEAVLRQLDQNTNTCKNEGVNRSLSTSLPKNVNFSRNARARMLATCDRINKGIGESLLHKLEVVGAPISKGGRVARAVRQMQQEEDYLKAYKKSAKARKKHVQAKYRQRREVHNAKATRKQQTRGKYVKGQLDPKVDHSKVRAAQQHLQRQQRQQLREAKTAAQSNRKKEKTTCNHKPDHTYAYNFRQKSDHRYSQ